MPSANTVYSCAEMTAFKSGSAQPTNLPETSYALATQFILILFGIWYVDGLNKHVYIVSIVNNYSTSVGSIQTLKSGISSVATIGSQNLLSTSYTLQSNITYLENTFQQGYNVLTASTIKTPYFWASTLVTLISEQNPVISTPASGISSMGITYYPLFSSVYNSFSDTRVFGEPLQDIPVYQTDIDLTNFNQKPTFTTSGGIVYSKIFALQ